MFKCINCGYIAGEFKGKVSGIHQGSFSFKACCPECESYMVNILPGPTEEDLRISVVKTDDYEKAVRLTRDHPELAAKMATAYKFMQDNIVNVIHLTQGEKNILLEYGIIEKVA